MDRFDDFFTGMLASFTSTPAYSSKHPETTIRTDGPRTAGGGHHGRLIDLAAASQ
jgi:hypothetical protein